MSPTAILIDRLSHSYNGRPALEELSISVEVGEIFGLLGPNGGGKTTLFRILATLLPIQSGHVEILGLDPSRNAGDVRRLIGVTFQSPSVDGRLTVAENLKHQAHLYGLRGRKLALRMERLVSQFGLNDRLQQQVDTLSGGFKRRVELAKGLLHEPGVLLLDEPGTGLDPGARHDLWRYLRGLQSELNVTVLVTTHLMEEADECDRLAILDRGRFVAGGTPVELRASIGGECLSIHSARPSVLSERIEAEFGVTVCRIGDVLRIEQQRGHELLRALVDRFGDEIESVSLGRPTLRDVFMARTGHVFEGESPA